MVVGTYIIERPFVTWEHPLSTDFLFTFYSFFRKSSSTVRKSRNSSLNKSPKICFLNRAVNKNRKSVQGPVHITNFCFVQPVEKRPWTSTSTENWCESVVFSLLCRHRRTLPNARGNFGSSFFGNHQHSTGCCHGDIGKDTEDSCHILFFWIIHLVVDSTTDSHWHEKIVLLLGKTRTRE